jgi:ATP-dependent Clp protease ATP-binding subunit ClpA
MRRSTWPQSNHSEISNEHFLLALLRQTDGLARPVLEGLGIAPMQLEKQLESKLAHRASVDGGSSPPWSRPSQNDRRR